MFDRSLYSVLKEKAVKTAQKIGQPSFYTVHKNELDISYSNLSNNKMLHKCHSHLNETRLHPAHGIAHCEKVAAEAGAIILIESSNNNYHSSQIERMLLSVQISGLLHDIKRIEKDHTIAGSIEAERILKDFDIEENYKRYITAAIRNHEAFKEVISSEDETARIVSDSLYDADKFRWGPDNFTTTLWLITESTGTSPEELYSIFEEKMRGIKAIKNTFRSETGKRYGPEFIDMGIRIADEIYNEMKHFLGGK